MEILYSTATTISSGAMTLINIFSEFIVAKLQFLVKPPSYDLLMQLAHPFDRSVVGSQFAIELFWVTREGKWHNGFC
jgi:hypothetical protein